MDRAGYLDHLAADTASVAAAVESGPLGAPVPWCGSWSVADLTVHLGGIHRWARHVIERGERPEAGYDPVADDPAPLDAASLAIWIRLGSERLSEALVGLADDAPTWHPFPVNRVGAVWPRRMAQETAVHRWDVQRAMGANPTIDAALAVDGIDEYLTLALPRLIVRERLEVAEGSLEVRASDTGDRWLVTARGGTIEVGPAAPPTVSIVQLSGTAQDVLLALWGRPVPAQRLASRGDSASWLSRGGM